MRLGNSSHYHDQKNDASAALFKRYFGKKKFIACGPCTAAMGFEIGGWPIVCTPREQFSDSILMILNSPHNYNVLRGRRVLDYDKYPPNEVPQTYDVLGQILYKTDKACKFSWGISFDQIKNNFKNKITTMMCGKFPFGGHYVLATGYKDDKIIYDDPYKGYNLEMDLDFFEKKIRKIFNWRVDFFPK